MPRKLNKEEFIVRAKEKHNNKYDYSQVKYEKTKKKVTIICPEHGAWQQTPSKHMAGCGCPKCIGRHQTTEDFIIKARNIHGDVYDYSNTIYNRVHTKVTIICKKHGEFLMTPVNHTSHLQGCPTCCESKGEKQIRNSLESNEIIFETQKRFDDCINPKNNYILPFDFFLPEHNTLIEFDGIQHFRFSTKFYKTLDDFHHRQYLDQIKNEYAKNNQIKLIRIPYNKIKYVEDLLKF